MMNDKELKTIINSLYMELSKKDANTKHILAKAVSIGMKYQEEKIKEGINIVFGNLKLPNS